MKCTMRDFARIMAATLVILLGTVGAAFAYTLSGTIYGGSAPLADAAVRVERAGTSDTVASTTTDPGGFYTVSDLDGSYKLTITPPGGSGYSESVVNVDVHGDVIQNVVLIRQGVVISGTVRNQEDGSPATNVTVYAYGANGATGGTGWVDADGYYSIAVSTGTFSITLRKRYEDSQLGYIGEYQVPAGNVSVPGNVTKDFAFIFPKPVTLSGKTTDVNGVALPNVYVYINGWSSSGPDANGGYTSASVSGGAPSDPSGNFRFTFLPGSNYNFTLYPSNSSYVSTTYSGVAVTEDTVKDFALNGSVILSGTVRNEDGSPATNVTVYAYGANGATGGTGWVDADGHYSIAVSTGTFSITLRKRYEDSQLGYIGEYQVSAGNVSVTGNVTKDFAFTFPKPVTLSGKTTDANGVAVPNVYMYINGWSSSGPDANGGYTSASVSGGAPSDANGGYRFTLLSAPNYGFTIYPPSGSNFLTTSLNGVSVTKDMLQNYVMSLPDTKAPEVLSGPTVSSKTDTTATIDWQTNEPAKGTIVYGTTNPPGSTVQESAAAFGTSHSQQLSGLTPNTTYYVMVTASDAAGNGPVTSAVAMFKTDATRDTTPPVFMNGPAVNTITHVSAVIEWTTDEPSTGVVSYGPSTTPSQTVTDDTLSTTHRVTISGLTPETLYHVQVTATDAAKNSAASNGSISFTTVAAPDVKPPKIVEGPMAIDVSDTAATITWTTDENATSGVSWNDGTGYDLVSDDTLVVKHAVTITKLSPSTTYSYTVASKDAFGNGPTLSMVKTFTTKASPDVNPPVFIQAPIVKNTTHQSAVLYWETDEMTSSTIVYGTSPAFGQSDAKAALIAKHNRPLTGLLPGTTYYFYVDATDAAKNTSTSQTYTFTTEQNPDTRAPVITSDASIIYSTDTAATVAFSTDKPCDTVVNYGPNGSIALQKSDSDKVNDHQITLTNLTPNTSYNVQVSCTDMSGNTVVASAGTPSTLMALNYAALLSDAFVGAAGIGFTTPSLPDTTAPVITATPAATAITSSMVRIAWGSDEIADSQVYFGLPGQGMKNFAGDIGQVTSHSVALTNLAAGTTYEFKVLSTDPSNNTTTSGVYTFTTAALADTTAPVVGAVSASAMSSSEIKVSWTTDEPSTTVLKYGTSASGLTGQLSVAGLSTSHTVTLYNLVPGTTYYLAPVSADGSGNSVQGSTRAVTLAGQAPASYTVTATAGSGGSVTPASASVFGGYRLALAVTPSQGYLINSVTGCGGTLVGKVYTTAAVTGNCAVSATFSIDPNAVPVLSSTAYPPQGTYTGGLLMVQLKASSQGASIYYTTDGSTPGTSSPIYTEPIEVTGTKTIKFFAAEGTTTESVKSASYTALASGHPGADFAGVKSGTSFTVYRSEAGRSAVTVYSGAQASFTDSAALKPNTLYSYTVASNLEGATPLMAVRTPLSSGWNIVAVPYSTTGVTPGTFFDAPVSSVYKWTPSGATAETSDSVLGSYSPVGALAPGNGYFVKTSNDTTLLAYSGTAGPSSSSVLLKPGWTMIANPRTGTKTNIGSSWLVDGKTLASAITSSTIAGGIYWWNGTTYDSWTILGDNPQIEPWKGYWMLNLDSVDHTLTIQ